MLMDIFLIQTNQLVDMAGGNLPHQFIMNVNEEAGIKVRLVCQGCFSLYHSCLAYISGRTWNKLLAHSYQTIQVLKSKFWTNKIVL